MRGISRLGYSRGQLLIGYSKRRLHSAGPLIPHAYLRPLVDASLPKAEELEGTACLVLDRKEARNALSVQMVQVGFALYGIHSGEMRMPEEES